MVVLNVAVDEKRNINIASELKNLWSHTTVIESIYHGDIVEIDPIPLSVEPNRSARFRLVSVFDPN